jgi:hypothetical protein
MELMFQKDALELRLSLFSQSTSSLYTPQNQQLSQPPVGRASLLYAGMPELDLVVPDPTVPAKSPAPYPTLSPWIPHCPRSVDSLTLHCFLFYFERRGVSKDPETASIPILSVTHLQKSPPKK